jgi:hypothetical protein
MSLEKKRNEENQKEEQKENPKKKQREKQEENHCLLPEWFPFVGANIPVLSVANHSETAYTALTELRKSHPDALWPENLETLKASKASHSRRRQQPELSQELLEIKKELSGVKNNVDKPLNDAMKDFEDREYAGILRHYTEDLQMQSIFITKQGYIGIGPNGLQAGDCVFLIADGNAPHILTHIDDVLRRRAA